MPKDYDVEEAFRAIENELIDSMMHNLSHHRAEEMKEGLNWTSWQAEQLKALNVYKQKNQKKFTKVFADINRNIEKSILLHRRAGETEQEKAILEAIKKGVKLTHKAGSTIEGAFFRINDRKLDALLSEINAGMRRAETAMLRMANDQYRKVIFNSQVYYNSGAGTYEKAVDMATKDFLSRGINCIQYKNGARVNIASYAGMALRTANTRAYCQGEGAKRQEWGISTVIVNKRGLPCPKCGRWTGKILIDDVWSGGKASDGPYPLMSQAMAGGLYHPNCKDGHSTYFPGISEKPEKVTKKEMKQAVVAEQQENRRNLIQRNIDKFDRLSTYSLDDGNKKQYAIRANEWHKKIDYMSNSFRPKYENVNPIKLQQKTIEVKKVSNSSFNMVTDIDNTTKNKAVRLTEKILKKLQKDLPDNFQLPKIAIVDFNRCGLSTYAIGGYHAQSKTMFINSKFDSPDKIIRFLTKNEERFANKTVYAPYLHELGHSYYYNKIGDIAIAQNIGYNEARKLVDRKLMNYLGNINNVKLKEELSQYAYDGYIRGNYSEVIAESFSSNESIYNEIMSFFEGI